MPLVSVSDIEGVNLNSTPYDVLKIDGVTVWEKVVFVNDESFNYVGYDINEKPDGAVDYDGVAVRYAIGKLSYTYFKKLDYVPTTAEEYYDYWVPMFSSSPYGFAKVTANNISSYVTVGTTQIYEITDSREDADGYNFDIVKVGGFNEKYYNYDFSTRISPSDPTQQIIPDDIVIPETYNGIPVTQILGSALSGGFEATSSGGSSIWSNYSQAWYIKSLTLPKTMKNIGANSICLLEQLTKDLEFPEGLEALGGVTNCAQPSKKYVFPKSLDLSLVTSSLVWDGASSQVSHSGVYTIVIQTPNLTLSSTANTFRYVKTVEFTTDVQSITGCLGYNGLPTNLVFRHSNSDAITLSLSKPKSATAVNIYTDNDVIRNYDWASMNYTATFYPLSDYVE